MITTADRVSLVWLATVAAAITAYLGVAGVLSSDAVAGLLGSVISLASGFTMRDQSARRETAIHESYQNGGDHAET